MEENQEECPGNTRSRNWRSTGINGGRGKSFLFISSVKSCQNERCTETERNEVQKLKRRGVSACNVFLVYKEGGVYWLMDRQI